MSVDPSSYYVIDLPEAAYSSELRVEPVIPSSSKELREHVERFARYFLREMHTGGIQFEAGEIPESTGYVPYRAYLFAVQDRYIGAGCFRERGDEDSDVPWVFDWLWFHPYFRSRGHLSRAWPVLVSEIGRFRLAYPLSHAMKAFLQKVGWSAS